jgi:hypothetical protein
LFCISVLPACLSACLPACLPVCLSNKSNGNRPTSYCRIIYRAPSIIIKIAELQLRTIIFEKMTEVSPSSCRLEVADYRKKCYCGNAVADQHFFLSCQIPIARVLPSSFGIAIEERKKKCCACPRLYIRHTVHRYSNVSYCTYVCDIPTRLHMIEHSVRLELRYFF